MKFASKWPSRVVIAMCALAGSLMIGSIQLLMQPKPSLLDDVPFGKMVLDRSGGILRLGLSADDKYRLRISLDEVAPEAAAALILYEDRYFYSHPGINIFSICRALGAMVLGGRRVGASTITMQVARLRHKLRTSTISGKLEQIWRALLLELHYSKEEILEAYFNLAPYGGNIEGIEAAARIYFNKPALSLTDMECHALAVAPQNPTARNPVNGKDFKTARQRLELMLAKERGQGSAMIEARLEARSAGQLVFPAPHLSLELLGKMREGKVVSHASIDRHIQLKMEKALHAYTQRNEKYGLRNGAIILVNTTTMEVEALAGSASFGNESISGQIDGTRARRSPGSTLKPFIYALALDEGIIHPASMLPDSPRSFGGYDPENFDRAFRGPLAAAESLRASRNLPAIYLAEKLRYPGLYGFLRSAQIRFEHDAGYYGLALALGGAEISMRDLAALYSMLANHGLWLPLKFEKDEIWSAPRRMLSPEAAFITLDMLSMKDAVVRSRGRELALRYKTGTSNGLRDAWTAGLVGQYVLVVWIGNFDNEANPHFVGAQAALPLFLELANLLASHKALKDLHKQPAANLNISKAPVCVSTGDFNISHCRETVETWFIPGVSPTRDTGILRPILLDRATGLRACKPEAGKTEEVWWEFWASDMRELFEHAGIYKPVPPEWLPECGNGENSMVYAQGPRIILPKKNVSYQRRVSGKPLRVPLMAAADADVGQVHWFAGSSYLGSSIPGEVFFWEPAAAGKVEITAVDDLNRSSRRKCRIMALP